MDFDRDESLEVDAILERIKNKLSMRNSRFNQNLSDEFSGEYNSAPVSDDDVVELTSQNFVDYSDDDSNIGTGNSSGGNYGGRYSSPGITRPLFLNDGNATDASDVIKIVDPNIIPNPFGNSMKQNIVRSNPSLTPVDNQSNQRLQSQVPMQNVDNNMKKSSHSEAPANLNMQRNNRPTNGFGGIVDLTPNMEIHPMHNQMTNYNSSKSNQNIIDIALNDAEYKLLVDVLSKRFCKAFSLKYLHGKVEKWMDANLKDLLASK